MRIDALTVVLRPRSSWEAVELGTALVRRHARAVWAPWLAVTLPVFALVNALLLAVDAIWLAAVLMWWLKPLFARIPLFVLSRAVFGEVPTARDTLRGAFRGGGRAMLGYLTWRRLGPARALLMPVDLLEGNRPAQAAARRRVVAGPAYGFAAATLIVFLHFEAAVALGLGMLAFLFVPEEHLLDSLQRLWQYLQDAPAWLGLLYGALAWAATSLLEPFHVGAGLGLYLNRRTEIEGWDIELAFRRLRARLQAGAVLGLLAVATLLLPTARATPPAPASPSSTERAQPARCSGDCASDPLARAFGREYVPAGGFDRAVERAYADPRLSPTRQTTVWKPRAKPGAAGGDAGWLTALGGAIATLGELALWIVAALVLGLLGWGLWRWWPALRGLAAPVQAKPGPAREQPAVPAEPLPDDVAGAARRLWAAGHAREALALAYRGSVEAMLRATGQALPPGATESQCLQAAQALPGPARQAFAQGVRLWQQAAYADRLPADDAFDAMLGALSERLGWAR